QPPSRQEPITSSSADPSPKLLTRWRRATRSCARWKPRWRLTCLRRQGPQAGSASPCIKPDSLEARMDANEILEIFRKNSALLEGHFVLSSGLHSDRYIQCALVLQHPRMAEQLCSELAGRLRHLGAKVVAAPALGGVIVAHEVARALNVRAVFTERQDKVMALRRGFSFAPAEPTLVVEDVMTTGGSTRETMDCVGQAGATVVGVGAL